MANVFMVNRGLEATVGTLRDYIDDPEERVMAAIALNALACLPKPKYATALLHLTRAIVGDAQKTWTA